MAQKKTKSTKIRLRDFKTGRFIWVDKKDYNKFWSEYSKEKKKFETQKNLKKQKEKRAAFKPVTLKELKRKKIKNKAALIELAKRLDEQGVEYSLEDLQEKTKGLSVKKIKEANIVVFPKIPDQYFYWNLQNRIARGEMGENVEYIVKSFSGQTVYKGFSENSVLDILDVYNKKIRASEKKFSDNLKAKVYPTVGVFESEVVSKDGKIKTDQVKIDYSFLRTNLPEDYNEDFLNEMNVKKNGIYFDGEGWYYVIEGESSDYFETKEEAQKVYLTHEEILNYI